MGIVAAITSAVASLGFSAAASTAIASGIVSTATGVIINTAANALFGRKPSQPKAQELTRELAQPTALPTYRHVYGRTRATGTPLNTPVKGEYIYGAWLLNSRPSRLSSIKVFLDKREVQFNGDPFNLASGDGGQATSSPFDTYVKFWIGRGDQTRPPQTFIDDAAYGSGSNEELYRDTDAWRGRTVIWMRLKAGDNEDRAERWPSAPPLVEVEGDWSYVWDPRDPAQDPNDPDTWGFDDNHALCVLDALRQNPMKRYQLPNLHLPSFIEGADSCDERVALRVGGTEARYRAAGTLTYERGELEDAVNPLALSGAADLIRIGGALGYKAGAWTAPATTLTTMLGEGFTFSDMTSGRELVNQLRVSYLSPDRGYETAELQPWDIPGAIAEDGGQEAPRDIELTFCPSPTQAMRVRKIAGLRMRRQDRIEGGQFPPESFDLVPGANASVRFPDPYDALDGIYEVEQVHPSLDPLGEEGVALRMPGTLVKTSAEIYAWSAAEEEDIITVAYDGTRKSVQPPGPLSAQPDNLNTGDTIIPRLRVLFFPSTSSGVTEYEMQTREYVDGQADDAGWGQKVTIDSQSLDGSGRVYGVTGALASSKTYDIRVRTVGSSGKSSYRTLTDVPTDGLVVTLTAPLPVEPFDTSTAGEIVAAYRTRNEPDTRAVQIWASSSNDIATASQLGADIFAGPNAIVSITEAGLATGETRYYFARTLGPYGSTSEFTASTAATAT